TDLPVTKQYMLIGFAVIVFPFSCVTRPGAHPFIMFGPFFGVCFIRLVTGNTIGCHISCMVSCYIPKCPTGIRVRSLPVAVYFINYFNHLRRGEFLIMSQLSFLGCLTARQ